MPRSLAVVSRSRRPSRLLVAGQRIRRLPRVADREDAGPARRRRARASASSRCRRTETAACSGRRRAPRPRSCRTVVVPERARRVLRRAVVLQQASGGEDRVAWVVDVATAAEEVPGRREGTASVPGPGAADAANAAHARLDQVDGRQVGPGHPRASLRLLVVAEQLRGRRRRDDAPARQLPLRLAHRLQQLRGPDIPPGGRGPCPAKARRHPGAEPGGAAASARAASWWNSAARRTSAGAAFLTRSVTAARSSWWARAAAWAAGTSGSSSARVSAGGDCEPPTASGSVSRSGGSLLQATRRQAVARAVAPCRVLWLTRPAPCSQPGVRAGTSLRQACVEGRGASRRRVRCGPVPVASLRPLRGELERDVEVGGLESHPRAPAAVLLRSFTASASGLEGCAS